MIYWPSAIVGATAMFFAWMVNNYPGGYCDATCIATVNSYCSLGGCF